MRCRHRRDVCESCVMPPCAALSAASALNCERQPSTQLSVSQLFSHRLFGAVTVNIYHTNLVNK
jgi:hypothetical protein